MNIIRSVFLNIFLLLSLIASGQNDPVIDRIIDLGKTDNKVMEHIDFLTNRIGDRLTGSDGYHSACIWAVNTMRSWGMMAEMQEAGDTGFWYSILYSRNKGPSERACNDFSPDSRRILDHEGQHKRRLVIN
jgi:hypothetical protein